MFCSKRGNANPDTAQFCNRCGSLLPPSAKFVPPTPSVATPHAPGPIPGAVPSHHPAHYYAPQAPYVGPTETSGKAIGSLIFGLFFFVLPSAILAIILGHWSLSDIRKAGGRLTGRGIGTAGMVLGYVGVASIPFILIIAAIAIPNILRARMVANEASALGSLRAMSTALSTYGAEYGSGYPTNLSVLTSGDAADGNCNHAGLLEPAFAIGRKNGYVFYYVPKYPGGADGPPPPAKGTTPKCPASGASGYEITADPITNNTTGVRHFFVDDSGVIRVSQGDGSANADSAPLE
jgi:type II secretory pathway pseudopilin PulG